MKYIIDFYEHKDKTDILREKNFVYQGEFHVAFSKGASVMLSDGYIYNVIGYISKLDVGANFANNVKINILLSKA